MQTMNELIKTNYFIISLFKIIYLVFMTYFLSKNKLITYKYYTLSLIPKQYYKTIYTCFYILIYIQHWRREFFKYHIITVNINLLKNCHTIRATVHEKNTYKLFFNLFYLLYIPSHLRLDTLLLLHLDILLPLHLNILLLPYRIIQLKLLFLK